MGRRCAHRSTVCQPWPGPGTTLRRNMNKTLRGLKKILRRSRGVVYAYKLSTIKAENGHLLQTGCGPNFCGNVITLCTCRHDIRTWMELDAWVGTWVAALTAAGPRGNNDDCLFYLMLVEKAFESHKDIWYALGSDVRQAKSARIHSCGDIYQPRPNLKSKFDYRHYYPPANNHVHLPDNDWHKDINYMSRGDRRPALLVGVPALSFLWPRPMIHFGASNRHPRHKKWDHIWDFIESLI